ncbi:hypothetical protein EC973_002038 [Apophysomyces ossiformis]|uniref:Uncharacterized protein n=1 Tax=Apophysomyces ossiformis TaxID=679940 RepID=A0A8H7BNI3_9FUNG|nr:hypothetical protein EC973_002038 [Apophysomyces ossiformis]
MQQWRQNIHPLEVLAWREIYSFISTAQKAVVEEDYDSCHRVSITWHFLQEHISAKQILSQKPISIKRRASVLSKEGDWLVNYGKLLVLALFAPDIFAENAKLSEEEKQQIKGAYGSLLCNGPRQTLLGRLGQYLIPSIVLFAHSCADTDCFPGSVYDNMMSFSWYDFELKETDKDHAISQLVKHTIRQPAEAIPRLLDHMPEKEGPAFMLSLAVLRQMVDPAKEQPEIMQVLLQHLKG